MAAVRIVKIFLFIIRDGWAVWFVFCLPTSTIINPVDPPIDTVRGTEHTGERVGGDGWGGGLFNMTSLAGSSGIIESRVSRTCVVTEQTSRCVWSINWYERACAHYVYGVFTGRQFDK